jgi:HEAT repeat protein
MVHNSADNEKIERLMKSEDEEERLAALRILDPNNLDFSLKLIYSALADDSWRVRKAGTEMFLSRPDAGSHVADIIQFLYSEENAGLRNTAVEILTHLGKIAVPKLLNEVSSADHDVRKFALDILGEIPDERSLPVIQSALKDVDSNVRAAAAENLGKLGAASAVPALLEAMETQDLLLRFTILEALSQLDVAIPVDRLLVFKQDKLLRKALLDCLGCVGDASAVPFLVQCLSDDMKNVRESAVLALSRLSTQAQDVMDSVESVTAKNSGLSESVSDLLQSPALTVRRAATDLLGRLGGNGSIQHLLGLLDDQELQEPAVNSLVVIGRTNIQSLLDIWSEVDARSKAYLAYVYGVVQSEKAIPRLIEGCSGSDDNLRQMSIQSLGKVGDVTVLDRLTESFSDLNGDVREAALQALSRLGEKYPTQIIEKLSPLLEHVDEQIRMYAVTVLGRIDGEETQEHLAFAIKDESAEVRSAAIRAIEGRGGATHLSALMLALTDEDSDVRTLAARALGMSGEKDAAKPLELALQDEDMWVRAAAVRSIGNLNGMECESLIVGALQDPVGLVSLSALETLESFNANDLMVYAEKSLEHPDAEVVLSALNILQKNTQYDWVETYREKLLGHPHGEVRLQFAKQLAAVAGTECCDDLEAVAFNEEDEYLRQELQLLLMSLKQDQDH